MSAWSASEDAIMLGYGHVPVRALAQQIGRSISKVYDRARTLGLTRKKRGGSPYKEPTMEREQDAVETYFVQRDLVCWRSAITGKFVTREYAMAHPDMTVRHVIRVFRRHTRKAKR